jgi:3D (Asp-Asp-Asp) domain-containing protein
VTYKGPGSWKARRRQSTRQVIVIFAALVPAGHFAELNHFGAAGKEAWEAHAMGGRDSAVPFPSSPMDFLATAYCENGITKAGVPVAHGIVAADPAVLPLGSLIYVDVPWHGGTYRVMDTGRLIKRRMIDIYIPGMRSAVWFGRQNVRVTVLKYGSSGRIRPVPLSSRENPSRPVRGRGGASQGKIRKG